MTKRAYIFDIDGTLSNVAHRLHHIEKKPADWPAFLAAVDQDAPIPHMIELAQRLAEHDDILFVTGRSDDVRPETLTWLQAQLPCGGAWIDSTDLFMRRHGDHRADTIVKSELMDLVIAAGWTPILVFEDRASVVTMWRERGIPCLQVAPGDF
jgi:phosphoglycolate phosphatase-like HAD superfamily hydrolase